MPGFTGRLFGPGLAGTGVAASGRWQDGRLDLAADGRHFVVDGLPTIDARGFNAAQLRVTWGAAGDEFVFFVDHGGRSVFAANAPAQLADALVGAERRRADVDRHFRFGWAGLLLFLVVPLLTLAAFVLRSDDLGAWVVERIPHEHEARFGDAVLAQTRARMHLIEQGPAVDAVRAIGESLTPGTRHHYRWFVAERPEINAFAAPGGVVVVFTGLLRAAERPEELAGVIAHEVAHAELRHGLQGMVKSVGLRALLAITLGDWSGGVLADTATSLTEMRFSRDAERAADADGFRRLVAARIDPAGMSTLFEKLARQEGGVSPPAILSSHPANTERIAALRRGAAAQHGEWRAPAVDWAAVKAQVAAAK